MKTSVFLGTSLVIGSSFHIIYLLNQNQLVQQESLLDFSTDAAHTMMMLARKLSGPR